MFIKYNVKTEDFAEKYYIKKFRKKYKTYWETTFRGLEKVLENLDSVRGTDMIEEIRSQGDLAVLKMQFRVAGTNFSKKTSGNRCILSANRKTREIRILLVYHKNDLGGKNETVTWKKLIRDNYSDYYFCK